MASGFLGVAVIASGTVAYYSALGKMEEIRAIMLHRFQKGEVPANVFERVFQDVDPSRIAKYWQV